MAEVEVPPDLATNVHLQRHLATSTQPVSAKHRRYERHQTIAASTYSKRHRRAKTPLHHIALASLLAFIALLALVSPVASARSAAPSFSLESRHVQQQQDQLFQQLRAADATDTDEHASKGTTLTHEERQQLITSILNGVDLDFILAARKEHLGDPATESPRRRRRTLFNLGKRSNQNGIAKREVQSSAQKAVYIILIPVLVIMSGIFAGLTLGYMSLDETQLHVLATTGTPTQKRYAEKILPVRKDGHLLLTTLLVANMITNETLPVIADPLFSNAVYAVVVSTVLVIIFSELVPQSICSRYGLQIGAYMAFPTRCIIWALFPIGWPVSRILHWTLGPHHGIVYRRAELKELVLMHAASGGRGGDLKGDTVLMVGGALDLQEKVVQQAMTPIDRVFMLPMDAKLDYPTLERVVRSGHSRIPVYQEIEVQVQQRSGVNTPNRKAGMQGIFSALSRRSTSNRAGSGDKASHNTVDEATPAQQSTDGNPNLDVDKGTASPAPMSPIGADNVVKRKKIIGVLLVKSCVLLDPEDATPVSEMTINAVPTVSYDEPLTNVMAAFQDGRSHMAIVTSLSRNTTDPFAGADTPSKGVAASSRAVSAPRTDGLDAIDEERQLDIRPSRASTGTDEEGSASSHGLMGFWRRRVHSEEQAEQDIPADAALPADTHEGPLKPGRGDTLGIITLEDVLEEVLGEIYDEYDSREDGESAWNNITPPLSPEVRGHFASGEAEKKQFDPLGAAALPPPQPSAAVVNEVTSPVAQLQSNTTLLSRLGLTGRQRANDSVQGSPAATVQKTAATDGMSPLESVSSVETTAGAEVQETKDPVSTAAAAPSTSGLESVVATPAAPASAAVASRDYFQPMRSGSLPPGSSLLVMSPGSRPTTPAVADATSPSALTAPQPNRPVVLRKSLPGGGHQNIIVGEALLRGRRPAPGTPVNVVSGSSGNASDVTAIRSLTPKPSRFKSTPVGNATPSHPTRGWSQTRRDGTLDSGVQADEGTGGDGEGSGDVINVVAASPTIATEDGDKAAADDVP